jgi:hypothetical protein
MIRINKDEFLSHLEAVQPGLSAKEVVEQSSCFVFKDGYVMTYNDEIACRKKCSLKIEGAISAAPLMSILQKLPEDEVELIPKEEELIIKTKRRESGIRMEKDVLLPVDAIEKPTKWVSLPEGFSEAIDMVYQCAGTNEEAFSITCVHIHPKWLEATDDMQLIRYKIATGVTEPTLVRHTSIKHVVPLGMTEFAETETWLHFRNSSGLVFSCRRWLDKYIEFGQHLKGTGPKTVFPKGLAEAAATAEVFSSENSDNNQVLIELRPGKLRIKGVGVSGWYKEVKKLVYNGEPMSFMIPPKLLALLTKKYNECQIVNGDAFGRPIKKLKMVGESYVYVTCLELSDGNETKQEEE